MIHGILVKIFNPEGEKLFPVLQKTVRRYEELRQKEEELQGLGYSLLAKLVIQKTAYDVAVLPVEEPILRTMPLVMKDRRGLSTAAVFLEIREINSCNSLHSVYISLILHLNDRILHETRGEQMEPAQRIRRIRMIEKIEKYPNFSNKIGVKNTSGFVKKQQKK